MDGIRPILYGVADYGELRKADAWFVDRTAKIRNLEATRYAMFLRPRRFGKSLIVSMLQYYYDVKYKDRFDALFGGTEIGANPTAEHNKYLCLTFDFSAVEKVPGKVQRSFNSYAGICIDHFAQIYRDRLPEGLTEKVFEEKDCNEKLNVVFVGLKGLDLRLYIIIDEYDNFTNTILAESGQEAYHGLCHGDGFFKQFFTTLKTATGGADAPVSRLFVTGVSPVTMDDVTSGFNIATNISLRPQFADFAGFRHDDLRAISDYYGPRCGFDPDKAYNAALDWYDNYRFARGADVPCVANTTLVLSLFDYLWQTHEFPDKFIDSNLRTDYAKIRHLIVADRRLNGNFHVLEKLLTEGSLTEEMVDSFQARELTKKENFTSLLFWFGITTIAGSKFGKVRYGIPNETLKALAGKMIPDAYSDVHQIDGRVYEINSALVDFAQDGKWRPFVELLCTVVHDAFAVRDAKEGEAVVQATIVALLMAAKGPYFTRHEREAGGGFYDIALAPQLSRWPDIEHAALIELKYVKAGDPAPTPEELEKIKAEAKIQLDKYSSDPHLAAEWHSSVTLHRIVLAFHGGDCVLSEEI